MRAKETPGVAKRIPGRTSFFSFDFAQDKVKNYLGSTKKTIVDFCWGFSLYKQNKVEIFLKKQ